MVLMLGGHLASMAQFNDSLELGEVLIQDNRYPVKFSERMRNITVITSDEIANIPANSVQELLSYVSSVDIRQRGAGGVQGDITIRGGNFDQCLILIDGVKYSDPQTGHHMLNIPIQPQDIERIEILRGSASRIFGQNAFAGAINIVTKKEYNKRLGAGFNGGQYGTLGAQVNASTETQNGWGNRISLGYDKSNGYEDNRDYDIFQGTIQSRYLINPNAQVKFLGGYQEKAFGAQYFYTNPASNFKEYEETRAVFGTLSGQFAKLSNLTVNLNWRRHDDEFRLWRDSTHKGVNQHTSYVYSADANIYQQWKFGVTSFGAEFRNEQIHSSVLDTHQRNIASVYLEHRLPKHKLINAVIGTNVSYNEGYGWVAYPGADLSIKLHSLLHLNLSAGRSFRVPTFTDLYYTDGGPTSQGNPGLKPENAWTYEAGLIFQQGNLSVQTTYFMRDASSLIDWYKTGPTDPTWKAINVSGNQTQGIESDILYRPNIPIIKTVHLSHTWLNAGKLQYGQLSRYVYDYLKHQVVASVSLQYTKKINHTIYYRYLERLSYPTAHVVDTRISYREKKWNIWAQMDNLTGTEYYLSRNVKMPTGWFRMGAGINLN